MEFDMILDQEWILASDLLGVGGLPSSLAGLHKRAKNEGWEKRSVTTPGIRGRAFAYRLSDLPAHVVSIITGSAEIKHQPPQKNGGNSELLELIDTLSQEEQELVIYTLRRKGVEKLLEFCNQENQELISLTGIRRLAALSLNNLSDQKVREIFEGDETKDHHFNLTHKEAKA
ncbi:TPA: DNA-binding protein [Escherichia coli]|uniref:DNA-binding protein n=1 Tax=Escherichia coli TaxID=562 RepID=A0A792HQH9_ECOLX|nr:DNA-binding protein [Escherichia coli]